MKTIGIIALSGPCEEDKVLNAKRYFEQNGFNVKLSKNIFARDRYLAGSDNVKIEELRNFFEDSDIDIIINARGGYGTIRLINNVDYDVIKKNPKPFIGYSDITALLLMIYKKTGLTTYHGPMACSDFGNASVDEYSTECLTNALNGTNLEFCGNMIYKKGAASGVIWGGNLSTVVSLCGQDFIPDEDFIFFAEDLNEQVYKIDKMFTQLFNIEKFKKYCKGIVLGDFLGVDNDEWLKAYFKTFELPTAGGFKITHAFKKITIPVGRQAVLNNEKVIIYS